MMAGVDLVTRLSDWSGVPTGMLWVIGGILVAMVVGTIARFIHLPRLAPEKRRSRLLRLRSWWIIILLLSLAVLLGRTGVIVLMTVVSLLALHELVRLLPDAERTRGRRLLPLAFVAAVLQYLWIWLDLVMPALVFVPVFVSLGLTLRVVLTRNPAGFRHLVGVLEWGMMLLVFCVSHAAFLFMLPEDANPVAGAAGWFLYLILLTEFNDIAQALWGRPFGRHKIIPEVSPGKSWEGLAGAMVCTVVLSVVLAPLLTPLAEPAPALAGTAFGSWVDGLPLSPWPVLLAIVISAADFCGDIVISALKRDVHVKDSGTLLPGQGGILDRIDSLTFTAPLFAYGVMALHGGVM